VTAVAENTLALRHGANSAGIVTANLPAAVLEVRDALAEALPFLEPPDALLVEQLARLLVRIRLIDSYYDRLGGSMVDAQGRPRRSWQMYLGLIREFRVTAGALGIGPAARAEIMGGLAIGRREQEARNAQEELRGRYGKQGESGG
jgi:hypothetical protein